MQPKSNTRWLIVAAIVVALLWCSQQKKNHPILRTLGKLAKAAAVMLLADSDTPTPVVAERSVLVSPRDDAPLMMAGPEGGYAAGPIRELNDAGEPIIDHGAGW